MLLKAHGSCDMKGGLDALEDRGIELRGDISAAATVGKENGG